MGCGSPTEPVPIGDNYWRQNQFSFDDATWRQFIDYCGDLEEPIEVPFNPDPNEYEGPTRFARRSDLLTVEQLWEAWRDFRASAMAAFYKDFLDEVSGGGNTVPNLALLYLAPTAPNINLNYAEFEQWQNPTAIRSYLRDGAVLPAALHLALPQSYRERFIYVPPTYSMMQTMYEWPAGWGDAGQNNLQPVGWSTEPPGPDTLWGRQRWYDYDSRTAGTGGVTYRDYTLDSYFPTYSPGASQPFGTGAWVYHDFVEPRVECPGGTPKYGWGIYGAGADYPVFGAVSEPAGVSVAWSSGKHPVFTQKQGPNGTPAWTVPYGSFYDYFINRMQKKNIGLMLMGGWDTTAIFGHEQELRDALYGGT